jgi:DNA polymerase-3 subunit alpha
VDRGGEHLIALAKNRTGYYNLCKLVSLSWIEGLYYNPRVDKELLEKYHEGLIICSACLGGEIHRKIQAKNLQGAEEAVLWYKNIFGDDYYIEFQLHPQGKQDGNLETYERQKIQNVELLNIARRTGTKIIVSNDVHFVEEKHADAHERLICVGTGKDLDAPDRMHYTKQEWFKTEDEMRTLFPDLPEAFDNTIEIANKVEEYDISSAALMPQFHIPEDFATIEDYRNKITEETLRSEFGTQFDKLGGYEKVLRVKLESDYLASLAYEGAKERYGNHLSDEIRERIEFELNTLKTMGFPGYFLIVYDFINYARSISVDVGPGRGSAAGSVVAYCLRITDLDPIKYDLLFERFLNPDRVSMPDIDIDFDEDGRARVYDYVVQKYGKDRVAHVITFGTMATKMAIKDVARVQKLPLAEADKLVKYVPQKFDDETKKVNVHNCLELVPELKAAYNSDNRAMSDTLKYAAMLEGTVRQTGVHPCAVIIGADDLINYVPLSTANEKGSDEKIVVTQYEGALIEDVGLIKMDFLGLTTLSIVKDALRNIKETKEIDIDISKIPLDDKATYDLFSKGVTTGIFQFESPGMRKYFKELQPTQIGDIIAMNALYRPGPMKYIPQYINRKHGREAVTYPFPEMEKRLKETYGVTVYQEQVMLLSRDIAGFTRGEADNLRKAMGKKLVDKMQSLREKFLQGAQANGFTDIGKLEQIWNDWAEFSKYAFNKSHAAGYSWLAYQTAYLKAHYPSEFMAATLGRAINDTGGISKLMNECKMLKINVLPPDINNSNSNFAVDKEGNIRFGLAAIKGVGSHAAELIVEERLKNGDFTTIFNLVERISLHAVNRKIIEALAGAGALDGLGVVRPSYFIENEKKTTFVDALLRYGTAIQEEKASAQQSLFGGKTNAIKPPTPPAVAEYNQMEFLNKEKDLVGIYLSSHPLDKYKDVIKAFTTTDFTKLQNLDNIKTNTVVVAGRINRLQLMISKAGKEYGKFTMEDYSGLREWVLFGRDYAAYYPKLKEGDYYMLTANVQEKYNPQQSTYASIGLQQQAPQPKEKELRIAKMESLDAVKARGMRRIQLYLPVEKVTEDFVEDLTAAVGAPDEAAQSGLDLHIWLYDSSAQVKVNCRATAQKVVFDDPLFFFLEENELNFKVE